MSAIIWHECNPDGSLFAYRVLCMEHDQDGALTPSEPYARMRAAGHDIKNHEAAPCTQKRLILGMPCVLVDGHEGECFDRFGLRNPVEALQNAN